MAVLVVAAMPLAVAADKKPAAKGGGGRAALGGGAKSGGARGGMMSRQSGAARQAGGMHQGAGLRSGNKSAAGAKNLGQRGQGGTGQFTRAKGSSVKNFGGKGFATKSTQGRMAFRGGAGNAVALHSHSSGAFQPQAFHPQKYAAVFQSYHRVVHEQTWWVSHYNRVVLVGGGWYYWDSGYWYPAWGYEPAAVYVYDGPIYSYDNLPPDEVIMNVQSELEFQGYYHGVIDGQLGPQTRAAIAEFQRDHELETTSAVDEPTVNLLGLA